MSTSPDAAWRRTNLGHLLFAATGACIGRKLAVVRDAGFDGVTDAQLALFHHLDSGGARLTTLAARAGLAKQSMIELVDRAERQGLIERRADAGDARAKTVCFTRRGLNLRNALNRGVAAAERDFAVAVGAEGLHAMLRELSAYAGDAGREHGVERILGDAARRFVRDVLGAVHRHGYREVTEALLALFRTLDLEGSRLTDVAAAARITKQSMRALVERAETLGLVERAPDPDDRRAKTIRFSEAGLVMLDEMRRGVAEAEAGFARATGDAFLHDMKTRLTTYLAAPKD